MRDKLCDEEYLISKIKFNEEQITKKLGKVVSLEEDIVNGIQKYPRKNEDIIMDTKLRAFQLIYQLLRAKYSMGVDCCELEKYYEKGVDILLEIGVCKIGYVNFLHYFTLGILLETPRDIMDKLVKLADKEDINDMLFDFYVDAYGLSRSVSSTTFQKENPYKKAFEIKDIALKDAEEASIRLYQYVTNEWLLGHADYEWTDAHKRVGYVGLWSFESAAIAKIFKLDDSKLKEHNNYPYELAHYKD